MGRKSGFDIFDICAKAKTSKTNESSRGVVRSHALRHDPSTVLSEEIQTELQAQYPNEDAPAFDLRNSEDVVPVLAWNHIEDGLASPFIVHHFEFFSLDDLFPEKKDLCLSERFNTCEDFRNSLREAIRYDMVFDNQDGFYTTLSTEQRHEEVYNNKPLIGLWKTTSSHVRMKMTTEILQQYVGVSAPTGEEFLESIGTLCNSSQAPNHWTEVIGVAATQNKKLGDKTEHAWHQDYGCLEKGIDTRYGNNKHVFLGFPCENNYFGTGVLPHVIKLRQEQWIQRVDSTAEKPMFYQGNVPEEYIVRPLYAPGKEIIVFRDVDVLHSTPDIQYRTSLMRFG